MMIRITERGTGETIREIPITSGGQRKAEKVQAGVERNMDSANYTAEIIA